MAAPGAMLPLLAQLWELNDANAGVLLFGFFAGTSVGSLGARGSLRITVVCSCALAGTVTLLLGSALHGSAPLWPMALFGLALGICMTSISLQQSRSNAHRRIAELSRLNLVWAAGALASPVFCLHVALGFGTNHVFPAFSACFFLAAVLVLLTGRAGWQAAPTVERTGRTASLRGVLPLLCIIPLATGMESAVGGWLTTYASRSGLLLSGGVGLASLFWAGLLLCRIAYTNRRLAALVAQSLRWNSLLVAVGTAMLWIAKPTPFLFGGAFCLGWGLGSLYPVALALLLNRTEMGNLGFLIAGVGGSCLPLMTGLFSDRAGSIRAGMAFLLLPAAALAIAARIAADTLENHRVSPE